MRVPALIFSSLLLASPLAMAQGTSDSADAARQQAEMLKSVGIISFRPDQGRPDSNGWYPASLSDAGASTRFPCPYTEVTSEPPSKFVAYQRVATASCADGLGIQYTLTREDYATAAHAQPEGRLDHRGSGGAYRARLNMAEILAADQKGETQVRLTKMQGINGFDVVKGFEGICAMERTILSGLYLYQLSVTGDAQHCAKVSEMGAAFFSFLQISVASE